MDNIHAPATVTLPLMYKRIERMGEVMRAIVKEAEYSLLIIMWGEKGEKENRVLLDFSKPKLEVTMDPKLRDADNHLMLEYDVFEKIMLGQMKPGVALGQRDMLLRGSPYGFAKFIPLFDYGPLLYPEILADVGREGYARKSGYAPLKEAEMQDKIYEGKPIPIVDLSTFELIITKLINFMAFIIGFFVGLIRFRIFDKLSLFDVIASMSKGIEASKPADDKAPDNITNIDTNN